MKFGLQCPGLTLHPALVEPWERRAGSREVVAAAQRADALGFDWLSVPDHVVIPSDREAVMGPRWCECIAALSFLAGATRRIRLETHVLATPYRHPVILARSLATLDFLSGGRAIAGFGAGHMESEFQALGIPYAPRGRVTDEYIRAVIAQWTHPQPSYKGEYVDIPESVMEPKPIQKPHPPIWIGGNSRAAMRRAARFGDGWVPWLVSPKDVPGFLSYIREQPDFRDRPRPLDVVLPAAAMRGESRERMVLREATHPGSREEWLETIGTNERAGATGVSVHMPSGGGTFEHYLDRLEWFAQEVMPTFRGKGT